MITLVLVAASVALAPPARPVLVAAPAALGDDVSPKLAGKASQLLEAELPGAGIAVVPRAELDRLRAGAVGSEPPDLREALAALDRVRDLYLNLEFGKAAQAAAGPKDAFRAALPATGDLAPLAEALTYLGASHLGAKDEAAAKAAFQELLRLDPDHQLDAGIWSPQVLDGFARARTEFQKQPSATLSVASAPPLATVTLDGKRRGETPLTLDGVPLGSHALRIEAAGHAPFAGTVEVGAGGAQQEVRLEPARAGDELKVLEAEARGAGARASMVQRATALSTSADAGGVVVTALARAGESWVFAAALVLPDGGVRVAWTAIDADFLRAQPAAQALARSLASTEGPAFADAGVARPPLEPDFAARLLGISAPERQAGPGPVVAGEGSVFSTWWFWTGVGVVLIGGGAAGYLATRPEAPAPIVTLEPETVILDVGVHR